MIAASAFYIASAFALCACFLLWRKSDAPQNALLWLSITAIGYECWLALIGGLMSLAHIPVTIVSVGALNLVAAFFMARHILRSGGSLHAPRQRYKAPALDIAFAAALALVVAYLAFERFGGDAAIIYSTIDPADRMSAASHVMAAKSVIYTYPNMYFTHMGNGMFMEMLSPAFPGVMSFRAFEAKEAVNLWLAGMLFHSALRQYSDRLPSRIAFFAIAFAYALGYPWNNQLFGFGYLGASVSLIIFVHIGAKLMSADGVKPLFGLAAISMGCFGVGISYTLFAPPVFVAAFIAIILFYRRRANAIDPPSGASEDGGDASGRAQGAGGARAIAIPRWLPRALLAEVLVFAVPVVMTAAFTVFIGREGGMSVGSQLTDEGAIYRNLFSDFLPWLPFALLAIVIAARAAHRDFARVFAIAFLVFQAYFFVRMLRGGVSTYYYYKLNFVMWLIVLFLAGIAIDALLSHRRGAAFMCCYGAVWACVAVVGIQGLEARLTARNYNINPAAIPASGICFQVYTTNNFYLTDVAQNVVNIDWDTVGLAAHARGLRGAATRDNYFENRVEAVCDDFKRAYWIDFLVDEHIDQKPVTGIFELPGEGAKIWVVFTDSALYAENKAYIDSLERAYENPAGFVALLP